MNIEESIKILKELKENEWGELENCYAYGSEAIETLLTAYEKEKEKNKELDKENQGLFELYNFNDSSLLAKILKDYKKIIEKQTKEIEEYNIKILSNAGIYQLGFNDAVKSVENKIKAKIEIRKEEKENCKDSIEEKYLLREIYVLQSLLEKE